MDKCLEQGIQTVQKDHFTCRIRVFLLNICNLFIEYLFQIMQIVFHALLNQGVIC